MAEEANVVEPEGIDPQDNGYINKDGKVYKEVDPIEERSLLQDKANNLQNNIRSLQAEIAEKQTQLDIINQEIADLTTAIPDPKP